MASKVKLLKFYMIFITLLFYVWPSELDCCIELYLPAQVCDHCLYWIIHYKNNLKRSLGT